MRKSKIFIILALTGTVGVSACTGIDTQTSNPNQRTQEGVGVGALTGALVGVLAGDNKKERQRGAIVGALVGGAAGGLIGNNLDKQAAELANTLDDRIQIINTGDSLIVRMPQDILFAIDSTELRGTLRSDLSALATNLQNYPGSTVEITGHTDDTGSAAYNRDLSLRRAESVASEIAFNGVSRSRLRTFGAGYDQPIASNLNAEGRAKNRRVEIVIRPNS